MYVFCQAPVDTDSTMAMLYIRRYAEQFALRNSVEVEVELPSEVPTTPRALSSFETYYNILDLYIWLSYRFDKFNKRKTALRIKKQCQHQIERGLEIMSVLHKKDRTQKEKQLSQAPTFFYSKDNDEESIPEYVDIDKVKSILKRKLKRKIAKPTIE